MNNPRILVTAVGAELAFSIIKALGVSTLHPQIFGCDIYKEVVGKYWVEKFYQVPKVVCEDAYIQKLKQIVKKHQIQCIIPTADPDFFVLPKHKKAFREDLNCEILCNNLENIELFNNKWKTYEFFKANNLGTPVCIRFESVKQAIKEIEQYQLVFPLIIKPNTGGGSRSVFKLEHEKDLRLYGPVVPEGIIQEYLYPDTEEYSAGTFRTKPDTVHAIILKRTLKFGMTNTAEVIEQPELESYCKEVILKTSLQGSNNIQFRLTTSGPKLLEINPRFSGTAGIRAYFGFNDVEMWLKKVLYGEMIEQPAIKRGSVLRFMEEQYHFDD